MLHKFGFSQYESKVYEALASAEQPMDATMIVKHSGVPKAKIYEVISRMVEKGMVLESVSEKKKLYTALPLPLVIEKLTSEFQSDIQELEQHKVQKAVIDDQVWSLKADSSIGSQLKQMMENAERSIRFSAWEDDFHKYLPILLEKQQDGVKVEGVVIGDTPDGLAQIVPMKPSEQHVMLERFRLLIVDDREVVFAGVENDSWQAIKTQSQPFVRVFTDYFHHDLLLAKITGKYNDILLNDEEIMTELLQLKY
ncbi:sugar-specific transcriptional regulator TrmB [Paenibacillus rhizosphaerae]|uniref:Sugar-specific transcriptional regulator TrmB n=1 Tax=Paenibacillus rhizosphaerae TaxID=297318 RepID=A0A839TM58_9BACL|nr:TrmB family transcriptional regulator [Paenibacillus rhizosphaerae]MBB3126429.1 sugar-specific transcriptional regulator TrmB [Paenibacillus rhizosphaerae]